MESTRRTFLGAATAATAVSAIAGARGSKSTATPAGDKGKFYVAACTPCDKNLKFDE